MDANELKRRMAQLPEPVTDKLPPYWEYWRWELWQLAQTDRPENFTNWPCVYHTMLVNHWTDAVLYEFSVVREFLPMLSIEVSKAEYDNFIHQAYHLYQWQQVTGQRIKDLSTIVEFGGGYGAMALLCYRLGFRGLYVIYDLPEFSLLQQWYLSQYGIEAEWNPKREPKDVDLFMALYSLSEVPLEERAQYRIRSRSYLFLYSGQWEGWDNVMYFQDLLPFLPGLKDFVQWKHIELTHLPDRNNWYSFGW